MKTIAAWVLPGLLLVSGCTSAIGDAPTSPTQTTSTSTTTPPPTGGTPAPEPPALTITVTRDGVSPPLLNVPVGARVTFTNADTRPHDFSGGPDPSHPECPEIDEAGFVAAGQSRQTGVFTEARSCQFHDHTFIGVAAFMGRLVIQ